MGVWNVFWLGRDSRSQVVKHIPTVLANSTSMTSDTQWRFDQVQDMSIEQTWIFEHDIF